MANGKPQYIVRVLRSRRLYHIETRQGSGLADPKIENEVANLNIFRICLAIFEVTGCICTGAADCPRSLPDIPSGTTLNDIEQCRRSILTRIDPKSVVDMRSTFIFVTAESCPSSSIRDIR